MKKRQATKKYIKKRQMTKKYKKHTKKQRKTRNIIRRHRNTRKLNKKKQRGGLTDIEVASTIKKNIEEKNNKFQKFIKTEEKQTIENIIISLSKMLSEMTQPLIYFSEKTSEIIQKYYDPILHETTELDKIRVAYKKYYVAKKLTNDQFIYLILTTNESDFTVYDEDISRCINLKSEDNVNSIIFSCVFYINMIIMQHYVNSDPYFINPKLLKKYSDLIIKKEEEEFEGFGENFDFDLPAEEERKKKKAEEEAFENDFGGFDEKFE